MTDVSYTGDDEETGERKSDGKTWRRVDEVQAKAKYEVEIIAEKEQMSSGGR